MTLRDRVEKWTVATLVGGLFAVTFGLAMVGEELPARFTAPAILMALLLIIFLISPVEQIHKDVRFLRETTVGVKVKTFDSMRQFYKALDDALDAARRSLDLTHIRDNPPDDFGTNAATYYEGVINWLNEDSDRSVRRIIAVRNARMHAWAVQLSEQCQKSAGFQVRVINWAIDAPAVNMAVIDEQVVFLALTGDALQRTGGVALEHDLVGRFFGDYYDNLFKAAQPVQDYAREHPTWP